MQPAPQDSAILAAGGVLIQQEGTERKVLLVQRKRYGGDWVLPKGKLLASEDFADGALREVAEETGYPCQLKDFAGAISYKVGHQPKVVLFWNMEIAGEAHERDREEIARVEWVSISEALHRLSYPEERSLLARVASTNAATIERPFWGPSFVRILSRQSNRARARLARELDIFRVDLSALRQRTEKSPEWINQVEAHLRNAELYYGLRDIEGAWSCLHAARREAVYLLSDDELAMMAIEVREEAQKIDSWRGRVVEKLLKTTDNKPSAVCVVQAMALRDEYFANQYHKIWLGADQIAMVLMLTALMGLGYLSFLLVLRLSWGPHAGWQDIWGARRIANVLLMGYLGAAFSSALSLIRPSELNIPERVANHSVTIARVIFGAVAGLAGYSFLETRILPITVAQGIGAELMVAFVFGYAGDVAIAGIVPKITSSKG